jgi:hypothetical protein
MEGYIYLGQYYDVLGRELSLSDKKIGLSKDPVSREYQLNRTKSPIGYTIISLFKVDNMNKVEKMLHSILDGRRVSGEWFRDDDDTLTGEFINFMKTYGAESYDISKIKENRLSIESTPDLRLVNLGNDYGCDVELVRAYLGVDYDVLLRRDGILVFNGSEFDTPNKFYNRGLVRYVTGVNGGSGTNQLSQFIVKDTGERLRD